MFISRENESTRGREADMCSEMLWNRWTWEWLATFRPKKEISMLGRKSTEYKKNKKEQKLTEKERERRLTERREREREDAEFYEC